MCFSSLLLHGLLVDVLCVGGHSHVRHIGVTVHACDTVRLLFENLVEVWLFAGLVSALHHEVVLVLPIGHLLVLHVHVLPRC